MKIIIRNCIENDREVMEYDYEKFKNGRCVEFNDVKVLEKLLDEAKEIHYYNELYRQYDWIGVGLTIENGIFIIYIRKEYSRD